jgi:hypothetical protein
MRFGFGRFIFLLAISLSPYFCPHDLLKAAVPPGQIASGTSSSPAEAAIPGPRNSFLRMAAISQQASSEEVLPLLARNVVVSGYRGPAEKGSKPTEFLILLERYLLHAKELQRLAGPDETIRVPSCREAGPLLEAIGFKLRQPCGADTSLETADPERAFISNDSGFPIADLEQKLRADEPFVYPYAPARLPVLFTEKDWAAINNEAAEDLVSALLHDPGLARLYWALARMDEETRTTLKQTVGLPKLLPLASVLDFYGSGISIRSGRVLVPGGKASEAAWKNVVGAKTDSPAEFVTRLAAKDEGWLAAYFDALSRVSQAQQAYFADPRRLQRFYEALRGSDPHPGPAKFLIFRPNPGLSLLVARLQIEPNGQPLVPGDLQVWKDIVHRRGSPRIAAEWARRAGSWNNPEQLVEGMFGLSRVTADDAPLQIYLTLSEIDRGRSREQRLAPQTVRLLAQQFSRYSNQYLIFSEFHALNDASITRFLDVATALDHIRDGAARANAIGILQANVGLWQILARQGQISSSSWNDSWKGLLDPFSGVVSSIQAFDAGRASLTELFRSATGRSNVSQGELLSLLAGPDQSSAEGQQVRQLLANRMRLVVEAQRLASLDTLFALSDGLKQFAQGKATAATLSPLAAELQEFEMPRPFFSNRERTAWAAGLYDDRQTQSQARRDLLQIIKSPRSTQEVANTRSQLVPFLKNTLVGLNYAYYEPPGAQMLHNNPMFVRFHDFTGQMVAAEGQTWRTPLLLGRGWAAGGGVHLVGSLADLPYVLAEAEQDFIIPENVQALVWEDLVPSLLTSAVLPRWWRISSNELHAVTLYQRTGEELIEAAVENENARHAVMDILSDQMLPQRYELAENALRTKDSNRLLSEVTPAETFYLTAEFRRRFPTETGYWKSAGNELAEISRRYPAEVSPERLAQDFGVPHPALAQSYARELLNLKPFPAILGYSSRLLAESWESNNLYWARLADEMGYPPVMLNRLVPELTHRMIEKIFATYFEDWPAVLRAMRETGDEFRRGKIEPLPKSAATSRF